jgi:hypothetical protein
MAKKKQDTHQQKGEIRVRYRLERVITEKFSYELPKQKQPEGFEVNYNIEPLITSNVEQDKLFVKLKVKGILKSSQEQILSAESVFVFNIQNLKQYLTAKKGEDLFQPAFQPHMADFLGISISTLRGILIEKLSGTSLGRKFIPVVNPNSFFQVSPESPQKNRKT